MKSIFAIALLSASLALTGCGDKSEGNAAAPAGPVTAVPPPAGSSWSETVAETPDGGHLMGNPGAAIKIVEFGSYSCSHCRDFSEESAQPLKALVDSGKVSYEYRNFVRDPLDMTMVLLAQCSGKDAFFPLTEQLFGNQSAMFDKAQAMGDTAYQSAMSAPPQQRFIMLAGETGLDHT